MRVTKAIDPPLLATELATAGVAHNGLGFVPDAPASIAGELFTFDADGLVQELPPEAGPVVDAHDASKPRRSRSFETQEDAERLALVAERAQTDPSFAALAELALRGGQAP